MQEWEKWTKLRQTPDVRVKNCTPGWGASKPDKEQGPDGMGITIAVLGGTGGAGQHFVRLALERGHDVRVLARTPAKVERQQGSPLPVNLTVVKGDSTSEADVSALCTGCDLVVSAVGAPPRAPQQIMRLTAANILASKPPRVIAVSSLGLCGTSPTARFILTLVAGARNIEDAESADLLLRSATDKCKVVVVRPTALSEQPGTGNLATRESGMAIAALSKEDLALFLADMITDTSLDSSDGVQLYAAPSEHGGCVVS